MSVQRTFTVSCKEPIIIEKYVIESQNSYRKIFISEEKSQLSLD